MGDYQLKKSINKVILSSSDQRSRLWLWWLKVHRQISRVILTGLRTLGTTSSRLGRDQEDYLQISVSDHANLIVQFGTTCGLISDEIDLKQPPKKECVEKSMRFALREMNE